MSDVVTAGDIRAADLAAKSRAIEERQPKSETVPYVAQPVDHADIAARNEALGDTEEERALKSAAIDGRQPKSTTAPYVSEAPDRTAIRAATLRAQLRDLEAVETNQNEEK